MRSHVATAVLAALSALTASGQLKVDDGWGPARWGMKQKDVLNVLPGEVKRLTSNPAMRTFGGRLAEIGIDRNPVGIGGFVVPMPVYFFFDAGGGLDRVLMRSSQPATANEYFKVLEGGFGREHGEPSVRGANEKQTSLMSAWILPNTVIDLTFIEAGEFSMAAVDFQRRAGQTGQSLLRNLAPVIGPHFPRLVVVMTKPIETKELAAQDESIAISFRMARDAIGFELQNKTESPIKIDWDQVSFVESTGTAGKVLHSGVRLIEKDRPQAPTVVPPGAKITDQIIPINRIEYEKGWRLLPLLPERTSEMRALCGKTFQVFMPLDIASKIKNNSFQFRVDCE